MPEIPDVVAGEPVASSWGNAVRSRTTMRYDDLADLEASEPIPEQGALRWLDNPGALVVWDSAWVPVKPSRWHVVDLGEYANLEARNLDEPFVYETVVATPPIVGLDAGTTYQVQMTFALDAQQQAGATLWRYAARPVISGRTIYSPSVVVDAAARGYSAHLTGVGSRILTGVTETTLEAQLFGYDEVTPPRFLRGFIQWQVWASD